MDLWVKPKNDGKKWKLKNGYFKTEKPNLGPLPLEAYVLITISSFNSVRPSYQGQYLNIAHPRGNQNNYNPYINCLIYSFIWYT